MRRRAVHTDEVLVWMVGTLRLRTLRTVSCQHFHQKHGYLAAAARVIQILCLRNARDSIDELRASGIKPHAIEVLVETQRSSNHFSLHVRPHERVCTMIGRANNPIWQSASKRLLRRAIS